MAPLLFECVSADVRWRPFNRFLHFYVLNLRLHRIENRMSESVAMSETHTKNVIDSSRTRVLVFRRQRTSDSFQLTIWIARFDLSSLQQFNFIKLCVLFSINYYQRRYIYLYISKLKCRVRKINTEEKLN